MKFAEEVAQKSSCVRRDTLKGAVAVRDGEIIATGYNGAVGDIMPCTVRGECIRIKRNIPSGTQREIAYCVCAEQRLICDCARDGVALKGADVYVTHLPCATCVRLLIASGVTRVYYKNDYPNAFSHEIAKEANFELIQHTPSALRASTPLTPLHQRGTHS